jgi:hypothetical protein
MKYLILICCCAQLAARPSGQLPRGLVSTRDTLPQILTDRKAAFAFLDSVFKRPTFLFERLEPGLPVGMDTILLRFNNAVAANRQWFNAYKEKYAVSGQQLPYDPHFGITYKEYRRILDLAHAPIRLAPADSQHVTVLREDGLIHLTSTGEPHMISYLLIDPGHQQLVYGGDTIPFAGLSDPDLANRIGLITAGDTSQYTPTPIDWQGYSWRLEKTEIATGLDGIHVAARVVQIDLGRVSGQTAPLLRVHYEQLRVDSTVSNFDLIGYIH